MQSTDANARLSIHLVVSNIKGHNTGHGGHLYTVRDHFLELGRTVDCRIVVIGQAIPRALADLGAGVELVQCNGTVGLPAAVIRLRRLCAGERSRCVLHAFDTNAFLFCRLATAFTPLPILLTKCGGAVTRRYTPARHPDVVFHREDFEFYTSSGAPVAGRALRLIPNRVHVPDVAVDTASGELFPADADVRILRIARVCAKYEESIVQTIDLARDLVSRGVRARVAIIGYPEDARVLARVSKRVEGIGQVITDPGMTANASRHLLAADVVVASGRGVMEAALRNRITLFPVKGNRLPVLLDDRTVDAGLFHNFSDRTTLDPGDAVASVAALLADPALAAGYKDRLRVLAATHFDLRTRVPEYLELYRAATRAPSVASLLDMARQLTWFVATRLLRTVQELRK